MRMKERRVEKDIHINDINPSLDQILVIISYPQKRVYRIHILPSFRANTASSALLIKLSAFSVI